MTLGVFGTIIALSTPERRIEAVEVAWPSGQLQRFSDLEADRGYLLREGEQEPRPLPGFAAKP